MFGIKETDSLPIENLPVGTLTSFLQQEFLRRSPPPWRCQPEIPLLPSELTTLLGYSPRADVVLTNPATKSRVWVEFEVSRADPVANHAKFATAHLFLPQTPADHFVAMVSPHIDRGRRNLAAGTIRLMRRVGMSAFQTTLLPLFPPAEIKRLNHLPVKSLEGEAINVSEEVERVLAIVTPVGQWGRLNVHYAGDLLDVLMNLRGWNDDLGTPAGNKAWGKRVVTYFAYDPVSRLFAPSKFCAYTPILPSIGSSGELSPHWYRMTTAAYSDLNDGTHVMDGQRAWRHLTVGLGMRALTRSAAGRLTEDFTRWHDGHSAAVAIRGEEPTFLLPPLWYAQDPV